MITKDTPIFDEISLSHVFKKIYENSEYKKTKIDNILDKVKDLIENIADASIMLPIIKEVLEISVRNDEQLVKLAGIIQRILDKSDNKNNNFDINLILPQEEKTKLLEESRINNDGLSNEEIDEKLKHLDEMVKEAKTHIKQNEKTKISNVGNK